MPIHLLYATNNRSKLGYMRQVPEPLPIVLLSLGDAGIAIDIDSLVEAAIRFDLSHPAVSTAMVGISEMSYLEQAVAAANKGPLPQVALDQLPAIWASLQG